MILFVESPLELFISQIRKNWHCSGEESMSGIEDLIELEKSQLIMADSVPDDLIWKQRWIEKAQATRQKIEKMEE